MAKPMWFYQMMGAEIGPLSSAELMEKVQIGQVQADTLVRQGTDGKWIPADRWKGLLPKPAEEELPPAPPPTVKPSGSTSVAEPESNESVTAASGVVTTSKSPSAKDNVDDDAYHMQGDETGPYHAPHKDGFEFFEFVGFRQAITPPLYEVLCEHSRQQRLTITQITRRALADFLDKPELGQDKPPEPEAPPQPASLAGAVIQARSASE